MDKPASKWDRRKFLSASAGTAVGMACLPLANTGYLRAQKIGDKRRIALVGTGIRGSSLWGENPDL